MTFDVALTAPGPVVLRRDDGHRLPLAVERWLGTISGTDAAIAAAAAGPVLDIGCGPGRLLDAFVARGTEALGLDRSAVAVALAHAHGRHVIRRDVFDAIPDEGRWATALLLDGSIGIGGDPAALLARIRVLLRPGGTAIVEVDPPGTGSRSGQARVETGGGATPWFAWAHVDADGIDAVAGPFSVHDVAPIGTRWFAWLG